jgi:16S rRNA (cytosine967-C5)-methyltransferase
MRRLTLLGMADAVGLESLGGLTEEEVAWVERIMQIDRKLMHQPFQHAEMAVRQAGRADGRRRNAALADGMNKPAPLDLRVNALKANREDVIAKLAEAPIRQQPTPFAPLGLRVLTKPQLQNLPLFKDGHIEVQDEGSQILSASSAPSAARWWWTSAPAPAARRWRWARPCATPAACMRSTCRKSVWPS